MPRPRKDWSPLSVEIPSVVAVALDREKRRRRLPKSAIVTAALVRELRPKKKRAAAV